MKNSVLLLPTLVKSESPSINSGQMRKITSPLRHLSVVLWSVKFSFFLLWPVLWKYNKEWVVTKIKMTDNIKILMFVNSDPKKKGI